MTDLDAGASGPDLRTMVVTACRELTRRGLTHGTSGNVSVRYDARRFFVSPSGMDYEVLQAGDVPLMDLEGRWFGRRHSATRRSGYSLCNPARLAVQTPRSVISPVTNRAGVTSQARFSAVLASGTSLTVSIRPAELRPVMCVTSAGDRSSIGIADPASRDQSMVLAGSAA